LPVGTYEGKVFLGLKTFELMTIDHAGKGSGVGRDFSFPPGDGLAWGSACRAPIAATPSGRWASLNGKAPAGCYMVVIDCKQETYFVLKQTPSERQHTQRTLKLLVHEAMAN
jgi:hypothetical protein